jgi:hypothetical protein
MMSLGKRSDLIGPFWLCICFVASRRLTLHGALLTPLNIEAGSNKSNLPWFSRESGDMNRSFGATSATGVRYFVCLYNTGPKAVVNRRVSARKATKRTIEAAVVLA